uniref:CD244 molecule n=1 Tax=Calidris pygmaea TaxID=425635 RepID=A0A8C3K133_9CHAR
VWFFGGAVWCLEHLPAASLVLGAAGVGRGWCQEQAVAAGGELRLVPEKPPQGWVKVEWRVRLDTGDQHRILTADKSKTPQFSSGPFLGRAFFHPENLSLEIRRVTTADSGLYWAEFEGTTGALTSLFFCVSVWEPLAQPLLKTRILHQEQDRCNLSLLCTVPGATNVSYSWSCTGGQPGALGHQPQLDLQVLEVSASTVCLCNATNLVNWTMATINVTAACHPALLSILPWWVVAVTLLLALAISVAIVATRYRQRKRRKDPPAGLSPGLGWYHHQEPETCTIYSMIQPNRRVRLPHCSPSAPQPPSLKRKRLDRALVSTAYVEVTSTGPAHWCPPLQTSPPGPAGHHLS